MTAREKLAAAFASGAAVDPIQVASVLGVDVPPTYLRMDGVPMYTTIRSGLCVFVYETLTGRPVTMPAGATTKFAAAYLNARAAEALLAAAKPEDPPAPDPVLEVLPPSPVPRVLPADRLARAIIKVVPAETAVENWRAWPDGYREAVCLAIGVEERKITPTKWDAACREVTAYYTGG